MQWVIQKSEWAGADTGIQHINGPSAPSIIMLIRHGEKLKADQQCHVSSASLCLGASHLAYVTQLNQVVMMGTQLYHDACVPQHHKYCAHQIALLYVSL